MTSLPPASILLVISTEVLTLVTAETPVHLFGLARRKIAAIHLLSLTWWDSAVHLFSLAGRQATVTRLGICGNRSGGRT